MDCDTKLSQEQAMEAWANQIWFWRTHLDVFIENYFSTEKRPIKLHPFQKIIVRQAGNCDHIIDDESRGLGKTWKFALVLPALAVLYPDIRICCVSGSGHQSTLVLKKIRDLYNAQEPLRREIKHIKIARDQGSIRFNNGSEIYSRAMGSDGSGLRGGRNRVLFIDEGLLVPDKPIEEAAKPTLTNPREIITILRGQGYEIDDMPGKIIECSSGCYRFQDHYKRWKKVIDKMVEGDRSSFGLCLSYKIGLYHNIIEKSVIEAEKINKTPVIFALEYGCQHIGVNGAGFYRYDLIAKQRVLETVEVFQTPKTKARYILSCDIATSTAKGSDNAAMAIIKFTEREDGTFNKKLVCMRTHNGKSLKDLSDEIRKITISFPNIEKIIIDVNGLGEGIPSLLQNDYHDPETGKDYPPLIDEDADVSSSSAAIPIIHKYRGDNASNNRGALSIKMFLENGTLELPVPSVMAQNFVEDEEIKMDRDLLLEERAIFSDVDALQHELVNIRQYRTAGNTIRYDIPSRGKNHKDRYSALMMACLWLYDLETETTTEQIVRSGDSAFAVSVDLS